MEKEITYKEVAIANRRDGVEGKKVTGRRIFAIAFDGSSKLLPTDTIAKAKFTIDMAIQFGVPVYGGQLDFRGEQNLWWSFCEIATNTSILNAQDVADCIAYEVPTFGMGA
jgi:hypothetical protein